MHDIIALGRQARSNDVRRNMLSPPLASTYSRTTSGVACRHRLWAPHRVNNVGRVMMTLPPLDRTHGRQRRVWHDITAFGQHTWSDYVGRGMTSLPLDSTHGRTTSGVACHHHLWVAHTVERRLAWNNITSFGQHTRSNNLGRDMPSPPFDSIFFRTMLGVARHHRR